MIRLREISGENLRDILALKVAPEQEHFVASNDISIMEAYLALRYHGHVWPFGIYRDDTPVGFCMVGYGVDDEWKDAPAVARDSYNIWRLMVDRRYQGRGYGKEAFRCMLDFILSQPCGPAEKCWLSYEPENDRARALYESFGFRETGEMDGEEVIAVKSLKGPEVSGKRDLLSRVRIRRAVPEDLPAVVRMTLALWSDHTEEDMAEEMRPLLTDRECVVFLAWMDEDPVGFAQCQLRHDYVEGTESSPVGYLEGIWTGEAYRRAGLARALLERCEEWAKSMGCGEFASDCELTNRDSIQFHLHTGFSEANRIACFVKTI